MNVHLIVPPAGLWIISSFFNFPKLDLAEMLPVVFEQTRAKLLELALMKRSELPAQNHANSA